MLDVYLRDLRDALAHDDYVLTERVFEKARTFLLACEGNPAELEALGRRCEPYDYDEFFEVVDYQGNEAPVLASVIEGYRDLCKRISMKAFWYREVPRVTDGASTLLVARWLAHLAGFRHRCVELFLDDARREGYTYLQVRSSTKLYAAASFDVPLGAHVKGGMTVEATLKEELEEELGLGLEKDVQQLRFVGSYDFLDFPPGLDLITVEYRDVYCGLLEPESLAKVAFRDGEVAALCLFSVREVESMIQNRPDRVASGLFGSYPVYKKHWRN